MNDITRRVGALMKDVPVVDMHSDYAIELYRRELDGAPDALLREHVPALVEGGVTMEVLTVGGDFDIDGMQLWEPRVYRAIIDATLRQIAAHAEFRLVRDAADLRAAIRREGRSFLLALEGIRGVEDVADLRLLHAVGLRAIILTHNERNLAADGCGEPNPGGLSNFGVRVLREAEQLRLVLDLVHLSDPSFFDALDHWPFPPVVSHSNARALCAHRRNLTDEQIREIGRRGGVIGLNLLALFIDEDRARATPDRLADHAAHIASIAGAETLGLGPDYADYYIDAMQRWIQRDGLPSDTMKFIPGAKNVAHLPVFIEALAARGFCDAELAGILGGNALRVYSSILPESHERP